MNERKKPRYYYCKRLRLLDYLVRRGFRALGTMPDAKNPKYNVWKFEYTPELDKTLREYFAGKGGYHG